MDRFVRSQNVERYRRLLESVTEESKRRQYLICLAKSGKSKKTPACLQSWSGVVRAMNELEGRNVS